MAIGDTFEGLVGDEETPEEKALRLEEEKRQKKSAASVTPQRLREQAYAAQQEAEQRAAQERIATYGTDDPILASKVAATGAFSGDLAQRMAADPEGTKAAVEHAAALLGRGGIGDAPTGEPEGPPAPGRRYSVGTGAKGERYFTNLTPDELQAERHQAETILGARGEAPVRDLKRIPGMQDQPTSPGGAAAPARSPAEILFEGRLEQARSLVAKPDTQIEQLKKSAELFDELWKEPDITSAREVLKDKLMSGELGRRGVAAQTASQLDTALVQRAKTTQEYADDPTIDRTFYKPWHAFDDQPGRSGDPSAPATLLNPGGSLPVSDLAERALTTAQGERDALIAKSTPRELPRTAQIARGKLSPTAQRLKAQTEELSAGREAIRKRKQREEFGFEYEPPSIAGLFGFGE